MKENLSFVIPLDYFTDRMLKYLFVFALAMGVLDIVFNYLPGQTHIDAFEMVMLSFNITREDCIQNWYSATLTFFVSMTLMGVTGFYYYTGAQKKIIMGWGLLALFFAFMAFDDAAVFHERLGSSLKEYTHSSIKGMPSYDWHANLGPIFMLIGICSVYFLHKNIQDLKCRKLLLLGFFILFFAIGLDFVEGLNLKGMTSYHVRHFLKLIEEVFEMMAMSTMLVAFLRHLFLQIKSLKLDFE